MSTNSLYKYRVYCTVEAVFKYVWLDASVGAPTVCPTNTAHAITTSQTRIVEVRNPTTVSIEQESGQTGQNYRWDSISFDALANTTTLYTFSYPHDVSVLSALMITGEENREDVVSWRISPDTIVGVIISAVSATDTVINVSSTVTDNIKVGFTATLFDGVNTDVLGSVLQVDGDAGTITVETGAVNAFSAASPTYVRMDIYFLKNVEIGHPGRLTIGDSKIKSSFVPANTVVEAAYTNNHLTDDKRYVAYVEIMY